MRIFHISQDEFDKIKDTGAPIDIAALRENKLKSDISDVREVLESATELLSVDEILRILSQKYPERWTTWIDARNSKRIMPALNSFKGELKTDVEKRRHPGRGGRGSGKTTHVNLYGLISKNFEDVPKGFYGA